MDKYFSLFFLSLASFFFFFSLCLYYRARSFFRGSSENNTCFPWFFHLARKKMNGIFYFFKLQSIYDSGLACFSSKIKLQSIDFFVIQILAFLILTAFFTFFISFILALFFAFLISFALSSYILILMKNRKNEKIKKVLPDFLDWLSLAVSSGKATLPALHWILQHVSFPFLSSELEVFFKDLQLGIPKKTALLHLEKRVAQKDFSRFLLSLRHAEQLGTPLADALKHLSKQLKTERLSQAEKLSQLASQKILFPLLFIIMPCSFMVIFGPVFIRFMEGGIESLLFSSAF